MFVGSRAQPNVDGMRAFLLGTWPRIVDGVGIPTRLHVVGSIASKKGKLPEMANVTFHGVVDDLGEFYSRASVVVAPLIYGTGLKIKVVEALCRGCALVTTPVGAEGLEDGASTAFAVAEDWQDFARACSGLLTDHQARDEMRKAAHAFAIRHLSEETAYSEMEREFGNIASSLRNAL